MENTVFYYKGYAVEISTRDSNYTISKENKLIVECKQSFPYPTEAEIHAKLYIDRIAARNDGWIVS